jgi:hypothetical protein
MYVKYDIKGDPFDCPPKCDYSEYKVMGKSRSKTIEFMTGNESSVDIEACGSEICCF